MEKRDLLSFCLYPPLCCFKNLSFTLENVENNLFDVAGIRVVCSYVDDIYMLAEALAKQDDITVLKEKDYIEQPKPNG